MTTRDLGPDATRAAFPLGGIGTGNVSLGSRGDLRDWELANRPGKGRRNPFSFFAIRVETDGAATEGHDAAVTRVLEAALPGPHERDQGYVPGDLAGLPRLAHSSMSADYPIAQIAFADEQLPVEVILTAFTPFVPLEAADSGIPCAVLRYRVTNPVSSLARVAIAGSIANPVGVGHRADVYRNHAIELDQWTEWREADGFAGVWMGAVCDPSDPRAGTCALVTPDPAVTGKPRWLTGAWPDGAQAFWDQFRTSGRLTAEAVESLDEVAPEQPQLVGSLAVHYDIPPGESRDFEFWLTWSFPNRPRGWGGDIIHDDPFIADTVRNDYATRYPDAWAVAEDLARRLPDLEATTREFVTALYSRDLPPHLSEAVGANLAVLRSTTCFVLEGGVFAAWEGSLDLVGSCEGTCTHVWNYAQSLAWLFPALERSARRTEFLLETRDDGKQNFRTNRIFGSPPWEGPAAADGQLGSVIRVYREWLLSGDRQFVDEVWPAVQRALGYVARQWDADGDGVLAGTQHTTYDIDLVGENSLVNSLYLTALRAAAELADVVGEPGLAADWRRLAQIGAERIDARLYTGEYYRQNLDGDGARYQYGDGVLSDQLFGQFLAHVVGLGHMLPVDHVRSALGAVVRHNFRADLSRHESVQRAFALGHEAGLLLCSWPNGGRPALPFVYADEVWTGIEYQVAAHLLYEGLTDDGLRLVDATRRRHDGIVRNPWSEAEFGNHYARSLASWALLLGYTGQQSDAARGILRFDPVSAEPLDVFFSTGTAWGSAELRDGSVTLRVRGGTLRLAEVWLRGRRLVAAGTPEVVGPGEVARFENSTEPEPEPEHAAVQKETS